MFLENFPELKQLPEAKVEPYCRGEDKKYLDMLLAQWGIQRDRSCHRINTIARARTMPHSCIRSWLRLFVTKTEKELKRIRDASFVDRQSEEWDATFDPDGPCTEGTKQQSKGR